ncbi:MAG: hypothetical protein LBK52_04760 [Deltaproteobacteria bacterium]|jgi:hypothetical protein|nr:hypothetical protein [Deltaproteobacteria bacterium]
MIMSNKLELPEQLRSPKPQPWVLGLMFLIGLSFSLINLAFYHCLAPLWPAGPMGGIIFLDLVILVMALGGLWWGDSIRGESAAACPLLALTLILGSLFFLLAPLILPTLPVSRISGQGWGNYFGGRIWLVLLVLMPGFFLWGAAPPFLTALAFPQERGLARGLFPVFGLTLAALGLGASGLWWWPENAPPWLERSIGLPVVPVLITGLWLWAKTPRRDRADLPFWPSSNLGLWTGERGYGQDILISPRRTRTLTPALFFGTTAGTVAVAVWTIPSMAADPAVIWPAVPIILVSLALGALILGPLLAAPASPMTALGLDLFLLTLVLILGPRPPAGPALSWLSLGLILIPLGALWPLAARVSLVRYGFIPSGLGHTNLWFMGSLLIGLTVTAAFLVQYPQLAGYFYQAAIAGSILAAAASWNWVTAAAALAGTGTWFILFSG